MARVKAAALLVLLAIGLGALAAGTPVAGDTSVRAETAGINLGHSVQAGPRFVAAAADEVPATPLATVLLLATAGWGFVVVVDAPRPRPTRWRERRASRGPPSSLPA
jgi:hypothetical protein